MHYHLFSADFFSSLGSSILVVVIVVPGLEERKAGLTSVMVYLSEDSQASK